MGQYWSIEAFLVLTEYIDIRSRCPLSVDRLYQYLISIIVDRLLSLSYMFVRQ